MKGELQSQKHPERGERQMRQWTDGQSMAPWAAATGNPDLSGREVVARQPGECGF